MDPQNQQLIEAIRQLTAAVGKMNHPAESSVAQIILSLVPLAGVIFGWLLLFFFLLWNYKIRRELIRTGQFVPAFNKNFRTFALLLGSVSGAVGLPMTILFLAIEGKSYILLGGLIPLFTGVGLLIFYGLSRKAQDGQQRNETG